MGAGFAASMSDIFDDLFGDMMGGRRGRQPSGRERGADLRYNLEITLEEAFHGKTANVRMPISGHTLAKCDSASRGGFGPANQP
jgi:molecular chaperone DnaJ